MTLLSYAGRANLKRQFYSPSQDENTQVSPGASAPPSLGQTRRQMIAPQTLTPLTVAQIVERTTLHALLWLVVANMIGLMLGALLLYPSLGELLGRFGYGRWVPLHLNLQLYGWCSLPLVAFLFKLYLSDSSHPSSGLGRGVGRGPALAVSAWSGSLLFASLSWLAGESSGKLFLEWKGAARLLFPAALLLLAVVLLRGYLIKLKRRQASPPSILLSSLLLVGLFFVPFALYWAASPRVYPPYNPSSGGATGTSLLGSTLAIVLLFCLIPLLGNAQRSCERRLVVVTFVVLGAHFLFFAALDHGSVSNHETKQVLGLSSLLIWWPLLLRYYRGFRWPINSVRWLRAFAAWSALLLVTALLSFLPGVLEQWKFTNALVAHAHLAMAGMVTSFNASLLILLNRDTRLSRVFDHGLGFWFWQLGCAVFVFSLLLLGSLEGSDPGRLFRPDPATLALYSVRFVAGATMLVASFCWLRAAWASTRTPPERQAHV